MIIVFANQKGGVGKSTIAAMYANHLAEKAKNEVKLLEVDPQRSLSLKRNDDKETFESEEFSYDIEYYPLKDINESYRLMDYLRQTLQSNQIVIIDTPGNICDDYLAPIFTRSDYIICPFTYQNITMMSTSTFINVVEKLRKLDHEMQSKLIFLPNRINKSVGTKVELSAYKACNILLGKYGVVAPTIYAREEVARFNTFYNNKLQNEITKSCFSFLDEYIF